MPALLSLFTLVAAVALAPADQEKAPASNAVPIFDGKTLTGWEGNREIFRIEEGAIVGGTLKEKIARNEFLCTTRSYGDFDLRLKVKLLGGDGANAGVQFRTKRIPNHHEVSGYQADMGTGWWGALYDESRRNKVLEGPDQTAMKGTVKAGDWNDYRIRAEGKRIQLWLNGVQTVDYTEEDPTVDSTGLICVQIHGGPPGEAWYRDITITSLSSFKAEAARFADAGRRAKLAAAFPEIDKLFRDFAARAHVPGAAWGIVVDGDLAHAGAVGYRDVATKAAVDANTVFRIASMTKSFTAMAILSLRDEGKLALDDPAERYVPELEALTYPTADSPRITIRHLLSHSEGFPEDNPWGDQQLNVSGGQMSEMLRGGIPFSNAPGVAYEYSNYGFAILGRIVSRVSAMPYNDYLTSRILRPLGMASTVMEPARVPADRLAHGYRWQDEAWKEEPLLADGAFGAMGGMLTTIPDLSRYVGALLAAWPPRDAPEAGPIDRSSLREMQQIARFAGASSARAGAGAVQLNAGGYGYGLRIYQTCGFRHNVAHGGGLPGFGSLMRWLPDYGVGIIAFGNLTYTGWGGVVNDAFDALAKTGGLQPREAQPSPALVSARNSVSQLISRWDDGLAANIAAGNLFLDESSDRRRAHLDALHAKYGACAADEDRFDTVENALRGQWTVTCERGTLQASITLAPTMPPKVQFLSVRPSPAGRATTCGQ